MPRGACADTGSRCESLPCFPAQCRGIACLLTEFRLLWQSLCAHGLAADDVDAALDEGEDLLQSIRAIVMAMEPAKRKSVQRLLQATDPGAPMNAYAFDAPLID